MTFAMVLVALVVFTLLSYLLHKLFNWFGSFESKLVWIPQFIIVLAWTYLGAMFGMVIFFWIAEAFRITALG